MITTLRSRSRLMRAVVLLFTAVLVALAFVAAAASPAHADEINTDKYDYIFSGNVKCNGTPMAGATIIVSDVRGDEVRVKTDKNGKWKVGVPDRDQTYEVTLLQSSLPGGLIAKPSSAYPDSFTVTDRGLMRAAQFGLTDRHTVNFFADCEAAPATSGISTVVIVALSVATVLLLGFCIVLIILLLRKNKPSTP